MKVANDKPKHRKRDWHTEFGISRKWTRPPLEPLKAIFADTSEPRIFLREGTKSADVVIRFTRSLPSLSQRIREFLSSRGLDVSGAFDEILWQKAGRDKNTIWAELRKLGSEARRMAWLHFFRLSYLGHFHPSVDAWLKELEREIVAAQAKPLSGRPQTALAEKVSLAKRHRELSRLSSRIHEASIRSALQVPSTRNSALAETAARRLIWNEVRQFVYTDRHDDFIFSGEAFRAIPYGLAQLHLPTSWKPSQLATSLLSFERGLTYQTIEKKLASINRQRRTS